MISYTKEDMKMLASLCPDTSVAAVFLEDFDYDPKKFLKFLQGHHLHRDIEYLFEMPFEDLPLQINNANWMGYISFRFRLGK